MDCEKYRIHNIKWGKEDKLRDPELPDELIAYIGFHAAAGDELEEFFYGECSCSPEDFEMEVLEYFDDYFPDL